MNRLAVVLFNLGGPDSLAAVEPFLYNLFSDPAIIRLPQPLRWMIARLISRRRARPGRKGRFRRRGGILRIERQQQDLVRPVGRDLADRFVR